MKIPTKEESLNLLIKNKTPSKVIKHSKRVCEVAEAIAGKLVRKGIKLDKNLVIAAALLHDIERAKENHVAEGAKLLKRMGFPEVSKVIAKHSLYKLQQKNQKLSIWEEKIVFYADKRVIGGKVVSLEKRFKKLEKDYNVDLSKELEFTKKIEKELLADGKIKNLK